MRKVIRDSLIISLIVCMISLQSGCSMLTPGKQTFSVITTEPDARIYINGEYVGVGNVRISVPRNRTISVIAKKDGYYSAIRDIETKMSIAGTLDVVGGCIFLLPFIGLTFPGANSLKVDSISLILRKVPNKSCQGNQL